MRNNEKVTKLLKDFYITVRPEQKKGLQIITDYFKDIDTNAMSPLEISACSLLFNYIEETQRGKMPQLSTPSRFTSEKTLQIDPSTRNSLELTRTLSGEKTGSLISVIDRTVTPQGGRLLSTRLNCPSLSVKEINERLESVEYFKKMYPTFIDDIRAILKKCHDIERCLQRLSLRRGSPRDLAAIGTTIGEAQKLKQFLLDSEDQDFPNPLKEAIQCIKDLSYLEKELSNALRENLPFIYSDGGFIKLGYSKEFDDWSNLKDNAKELLNELQKKYIKRTGISSLKIEDNGIVGIYVTVPVGQNSKMQEGNFTEFVHTQSTKNHVRYKTNEISELQDKLSRANEEAKNIELKIFEELTNKIVEKAEELSDLSKSISSIDLYSSFALLANEKNFTRPIITDDLECEIIGGRHPVVEHFLSKSGVQFTNNNCHLEEEKNRILLILGPNMGGKSTYLRQNALIIILAQMGCYVPVQSAKIGVVDKIFSRVGASDNLANDLSTFMIEMIETANILKKATKRSFVIMDEIGRGTSTLDGLAIAISVVEYLNEYIKSRTLFATHYHELVDLKDQLKLVTSYKLDVKENNGNIIFTYKVVPGETDRSYGVHVAQLAGIPNPVVVRAQEILDQLEKQKQKFKFK